MFRSKNLLITGGAGFIGSNFIKYILNKFRNLNVFNLDKLTYASNIKSLNEFENYKNYKFIKGDICDTKLLSEIFRNYKIDGIINFAAETHVDNSISNPKLFVETNINGTFNLLNVAYKFWMDGPFVFKKEHILSKFHQVSTDEVFGSIEKGSFIESDSYLPNSPYSASKASADMLVRSFEKTYGLNTSISISSNNYGPNQNQEKFIPKIINSLLTEKEIPVYGKGDNVRDWINVLDNCKAIEKIFNHSESGEVYNVGASNEIKNTDLIDLIYEITNKIRPIKKKIVYVKDRFGHDFRYSLDISKIKTDFSWKPTKNFENSLKELIEFVIKSKNL